MKNRLKLVLLDLRTGQNVDIYVASFIAFLGAVLTAFGVVDQTVILVVLLLCVIPMLNLLLRIYDRVTARSEGALTPSDRFSDDFDKQWSIVNDLVMVGVTLIRTVRNHEADILNRLQSGKKVEVLLVNPDDATAMALTDSRRQFGDSDAVSNAAEVRLTIAALKRLVGMYPAASFELRTINFPISTGAICFDRSRATAKLFVETYPFRTGETQPHYMVDRSHGHWFDHFSEEIGKMWEAGQVLDLRPSSPPANATEL